MKSLSEFDALIILDCETTGLNPRMDRIIELAAQLYVYTQGEFKLVDQIDSLVKQKVKLPPRIITLTGITDDMLNQYGVEEQDLVKTFKIRFLANKATRMILLSYNANFDMNFIKGMLERNGENLANYSTAYIDILTIYKDRANYPHKLSDALVHYNLDQKYANTHRAIDDCIACYQVLLRMADEYDDINRYINLFGYNPNYPPRDIISGVQYCPQPYRKMTKLYQLCRLT